MMPSQDAVPIASDRRRVRGSTNYHAGAAAEAQVERLYLDHGHDLRARRWRGTGGELDLVFSKDDDIIFVEVKSSRTHARAAESLSQAQCRRLMSGAEAYLATTPRGLNTPARFDVALVDGQGRIAVVPNALLH